MEDLYEYMQEFLNKVKQRKYLLLQKLIQLKLEGKSIVGYGAPAKTTTLLHYFGIGSDIIDFIVDDSPLKIGKYTPGNHIPIVSSELLYSKQPDCLVILAWNFAESIIKKVRENGYKGECIIP